MRYIKVNTTTGETILLPIKRITAVVPREHGDGSIIYGRFRGYSTHVIVSHTVTDVGYLIDAANSDA